jgi:hypothetical protein
MLKTFVQKKSQNIACHFSSFVFLFLGVFGLVLRDGAGVDYAPKKNEELRFYRKNDLNRWFWDIFVIFLVCRRGKYRFSRMSKRNRYFKAATRVFRVLWVLICTVHLWWCRA